MVGLVDVVVRACISKKNVGPCNQDSGGGSSSGAVDGLLFNSYVEQSLENSRFGHGLSVRTYALDIGP